MSSPPLTRRTQLLLDDELHRRLREIAAQRGISMGALIREAIDDKLSRSQDAQEVRARAIDKLLAAPPMPVDDWPVMKKQMLEDRYASVMRTLDTYD
jgi:plasmid stability protein